MKIVSSSSGTLPAARVVIMLSDFFIKSTGEKPEINLVMDSSMVSKDSKLCFKPEELRDEGKITGHLHLRRARSVEKAEDFLEVTLIKQEPAGKEVKDKAIGMLKK